MASHPGTQAVFTAAAFEAEDPDGDLRAPLIDLRYVAAIVRANLWLIAAIISASLAVALVTTMLATKRYTATASVQINDQSQRVLGNEVETDQMANNGWDTDRFLQTQVDVLKSRALAERVMKRLRLERSTINARRNELMKRGLVQAVGSKKNAQTGITNTLWGRV